MSAALEAIVARLEAVTAKLQTVGVRGGAGGGGDDDETEDYPQVVAYDQTFGPKLLQFLDSAKGIDALLLEGSQLVVNAFDEVRDLILLGARAAKPDPLDPVIQPVVDAKAAIDAWERKNFRCKWVNHLKAIHELISIFDWPLLGPSAGQYVTELTGAVQCYTNKILMEFRGKDEKQVKWVQGIVGALTAIPEYINDYHKNGLSWNARAPKATGPAKSKRSKGAAAPAAGAPPPAKPAAATAKPAAATAKPAAAAAPPPAKPATGPAAAAAKLALPVKPAAKTAAFKVSRPGLYTAEYYDGKDPVFPSTVEFRDLVNFYQCKNCTLRVPIKVKGITVLNCEKVNIVVGDIIGVLEITSSKRTIVHLTGGCHSITVDKCDNLQINVNEQSLDVQITVAQSQGLNVDVPDLKEEGNMIEFAVPEQIRVSLKDRKLVHEVYVHE